MTEDTSFQFLADELAIKAKKLGNLGVKLRFVFEGEGAVFIDATSDNVVVTQDETVPADVTISATHKVWLELRAKRLAPHVAAMTRKIKVSGDLVRGMALAPKIMAVL